MKRFLLGILSIGLLTAGQQVNAQTETLTKFTEAFSKKTVTARAKKAPETPDSLIRLEWNGSSYDTTEIMKSQYNQDGLPTTMVIKDWSNGTAYEVERNTYRYDAAKREIARVSENKVGDYWYPSYRDTSVYDAEGYPTLMLQQYFDGMEWQTSSGEKFTIEYERHGTKNLPVSRITEIIDSTGGWAKMEKMVAIIENGEYKEALQYVWNDSASDWTLAVKLTDLEFRDDRIDQPVKATIEVDLGGGMWMPVMRMSTTFNSEGDPLTQMLEMYNFFGGDWKPQTKTTFKYDAFGNNTETKNEVWEEQDKQTIVNRINLVYSANHTVLEREYEVDSTNSGTFVKTHKEIMGYQGITSITDNGRPAFEVSVYPNPVSDKLYISAEGISTGAVLTLTDASGKQVNAISITPTSMPSQLDLNGLKPGLYIVRLQSGAAAVSKTIIKN